MRSMEVVVVAGLLGLVAVGVWNAPRWLPEWRDSSIAAVPKGGIAGKTETKIIVPTPRHRAEKGGRSTVISDFTIGGFPTSKTEVDVPISPSPFPTRNDLHAGTTGVQIRAKYGEPTARITAMQSGQLVERYYYLNSDRTQLTVATLQQGIVVSADGIPR